MALRDSILLNSSTGAVVQSGSYEQRAWIQLSEDESQYDYFLETVDIEVTHWPACSEAACLTALADVAEITADETPSYSATSGGRYWIENRKTSPKAYTFELTSEIRYRYKNGVAIPDQPE